MIIADINYIEAIETNEVQGGSLILPPFYTALANGAGTSTAFGTALSFTNVAVLTNSLALPNHKMSASGVVAIAGATV